ncbi:MAG: ABC transporter permease [Clostridiales Family XIII bacterium]|jgi:osmoprotectant transport system permease protein|nr:ABC transporter permease [Clostridiales Family XIII bacterium]
MTGFFTYATKHWGRMLELLLQHLEIVGIVLGISICFAIPIGYLLTHSKIASAFVIGLFSVLYAVPSLAMFAILLRFTGLGMKTAVIAISIYAQYILLRSVTAGFSSVESSVLEASRGMGLGKAEILFRIQFPLAAPVFLSGIRIATIASVGLAAIASTIHSGGIGDLLFEGINNLYPVKIVWGVILSSGLAFALNFGLGKAERYLTKRAHP